MHVTYNEFLNEIVYRNNTNKNRLLKWEKQQEQDVNELKDSIATLQTKYEEFQSLSLKELLNSTNETGLKSIFENEGIHNNLLNNHYFLLIKFLLMEGLIDESYKLYLGIFSEGSISLNDKLFLSNILSSNKSDLLMEIISPKNVYEELEEYHFQRKAILNLEFLEWLIENDKKVEVMKITKACLDDDLIFVLSNLSKMNLKTYSNIFL